MEISYSFLALLGVATLFFRCAYNLYRFTQLLKSAGIPYVVLPFAEAPIRTRILVESLLYKAFVKYLLKPIGLGGYDEYLKINWRFTRRRWEKNYAFGKFGNVFCHVSPEWIQLDIADRDLVNYITGKEGRKKFDKPTWQYKTLEIFGANVVTSCDADWPRHRRVTAPAFNDRSYALVWETSINQALEMEYHWTSLRRHSSKGLLVEPGNTVIREPGRDAQKFALNVLSMAAFGLDVPFSESYRERRGSKANDQKDQRPLGKIAIFETTKTPPGFSMTFDHALSYTAEHFQSLLLFVNLWPFWDNKNKDAIQTLPRPRFTFGLPESLKANIIGWLDMGRYLGTLINMEKQSLNNIEQERLRIKKQEANNLLSLMLQNSTSGDLEYNGKAGVPFERRSGLSREELVGNAYVFTLAGHETTTGTIEFTLVALSLFQEAQHSFLKALDEELDRLPKDPSEWKYDEVYSQLVSCKCLMYEVLRVFPMIQLTPKWINPEVYPKGTTLMVPKRDSPAGRIKEWKPLHLPPKTLLNINCCGMHYNPHYWGPDVNEFRPSRWDASRDTEKKEWLAQFRDEKTGNEIRDSLTEPGLYTPPKGQFLPFGYGPRACLGKKFAIVEYCAAMAVLFRHWRVDLAPVEAGNMARGELEKNAWEKLEEVTHGVTTRMAEHVPVRLIRRC